MAQLQGDVVPDVRRLSMCDPEHDISWLFESLCHGVKTLYCLRLSVLGMKSVSCLGSCVQSQMCGLCVICGSVSTL